MLVDSGWVDNDHESAWYSHHTRTSVTSNISDIVDKSAVRPVNVLLTTGCFAPMHQGHVDMLVAAKNAVEEATGHPVVSAMISPDHQKYVHTKTEGYEIYDRIASIENMIADFTWMHVEKWGSLFVPYDMNFTTVYERFTRYLQSHCANSENITVWFVFGSDHMRYAQAFTEIGHGVCVSRGGYGHHEQQWRDNVCTTARSRCLSVDSATTEMSSTLIRSQPHRTVSPRGAVGLSETFSGDELLLVRNDLTEASHGILQGTGVDALVSILARFTPPHVTVKSHTIEKTHEHMGSCYPVISMDPFVDNDYTLEISRVFTPFDAQLFSRYSTHRPESPPLEKQFSTIRPGDYILVDDDIASGTTMRRATALLEENGVSVVQQYGLSNHKGQVWDFVDARDFVVGTQYGGLVVTYCGHTFRVPYMFPYVNLATRCRIEPRNTVELSLRLWEFNAEIYADSDAMVGDTTMRQMCVFGFEPSMKVTDFLQWHVELCASIVS